MAEARGRSVLPFLTQNAVISDGNNLASIVLLALILTPIQMFRCLNDILLCSTRLYPKWPKMKAMIRFLQKKATSGTLKRKSEVLYSYLGTLSAI